MERQEPTLGKDEDLKELEFRPRSYRGPAKHIASDSSDFWIRAGVCLIVLIVTAMWLIEWNARRQAAAMTAELMRPMTKNEELQLKAQAERFKKKIDEENAAEMESLRKALWNTKEEISVYRPRPLEAGERCMQGRRLQRIENGWKQLKDPC
ncbi:hypothetical protein [Xanthomonas sp. LF06-19]|uniref:hypothetical protein n=1 Tax=Xanthomonas sp. LF06-19 TaxID=3097551 RepID=UPI002A8313D4|nr:hypothetical protein [Xanthomonas sp. LF06-19]MDY4283821.1 hypothetical protein [Xanthomonas sp. LF06-19]